MPRSTKREEVYAAIDSERDYQDKLWNPETTTSGGLHEVGALHTVHAGLPRRSSPPNLQGRRPGGQPGGAEHHPQGDHSGRRVHGGARSSKESRFWIT